MKKKITPSSANNLLKKWEKTRDIYQDWVAKTELRNFFFNNINYNNFSLWWICNLVNRDNELDNSWYINLHKIISQNIYIKKKFNFFICFLKLLRNLILKIFFNFIKKIFFFKQKKKKKYINCFHSYDYNLKYEEKKTIDILFGLTPIKKFKKKNTYLIQIINYQNFFKNFDNSKKKDFLKENFILDEFISTREIIQIYLAVFFLYFKCINFLKKNRVFILKSRDCSNVLEPFLLKSFFGSIQNYLITSIAIKNFLNQYNSIKNFIGYGAFLPGYSSNYFFLKKTTNPPFVVTIQHGYSNENKLFYKFSTKEFSAKNTNNFNSLYFSTPDLYFVQGDQYKKILEKFFFNKIKIIGALNRDKKNFILNKEIKNNPLRNNKKKIVLIVTSIGDERLLFNFFNKIKNFNKDLLFVLSPHPLYIDETLKLFQKSLKNSEIKYFNNMSSEMLISVSFLVILSQSAVAFEALLRGVPSLRVIDKFYPPLFAKSDGFPLVETKKHFSLFFKNLRLIKNNTKFKKKIIKNLFYKLDNKSYLRFWKYLAKYTKKK